jgi:hypothetical protein
LKANKFIQNNFIREVGLFLLRNYSKIAADSDCPRVLINSIPKAGTHLVTQMLTESTGLRNSYIHIDHRSINTAGNARQRDLDFSLELLVKHLRAAPMGTFLSSHLYYDDRLVATALEEGIPIVFVVRDPRAILVSRFNYVLNLKRHERFSYFNSLSSDIERYKALIYGNEGTPYIRPFKDGLNCFLPWLNDERVLTVRYESLVGSKRGGSAEEQKESISKLKMFLNVDFDFEILKTGLASTPTLRSGKAYGWRDEMPDEISQVMLDEFSEQIKILGYEL